MGTSFSIGWEAQHKMSRQQTGSSLIHDNALAHLVVGVRDLKAALALWVETFGFELVERRNGADAELARIWGLQPEGVTAQALVGTPGVKTGRLLFAQFADPLPPVRRDARPTDLNPKNIDIVCRDLPQRYEELLKLGHKFRSPYVRYQVTDVPGEPLDVFEAQMFAHDDVNVVIIEILKRAYTFSPKHYGGMTNFVPTVPDADAEQRFYQNVLALPFHSKHELKGAAIEQMIGLPKGGCLDIRMMGTDDNYYGRVEMVDYKGAAGFNRYPLARPPALGILHAAFFTRSVAEVRRRAQAARVAVIEHGTVETMFGAGAAISVHTPAGLRLEIHKRG